MRTLEVKLIQYNKPLRQVLFEDFKSIGKKLPIKGGWGYTQEDAIIIDKNDVAAELWQPFNGVGLEYFIAEKRIFEEIIIFRAKGDKFRNVKITLNKQTLFTIEDGRSYDRLKFNVNAFHDPDFIEIEKELFARMRDEEVDFDKFFESKKEMRYQYSPEFWFDITSFINTISI